jgi:hypothetical protein
MEAARLRSAMRSGAPASACLLHVRKDGLTFWNYMQTVPILDETGRYSKPCLHRILHSWFPEGLGHTCKELVMLLVPKVSAV